MIKPSDVCIESLPSLPLSQRSQLPEATCIYFAIDSYGTVQYVGQTVNAKRRWACHHQRPNLEQKKGIKVAWLEIGDCHSLNDIENAFIRYFSPPLNGKTSFACEGKPSSALRIKLPVMAELFYIAESRFLHHHSLIKTVERNLVENASLPQGVAAIATAVEIEATMSGRTPKQVIEAFLTEKGYDAEIDASNMADALIKAWKIKSKAQNDDS